jgi:membrane-associated PAP2 superfamily phosphatase
MGWLVLALAMGVVLGIAVRLSQTVMRFLDCSLTVSLVVMLTALGIEVAQNPKFEQALSSHGLLVATLLISVSVVSIAWGWLLERGWTLLCRVR